MSGGWQRRVAVVGTSNIGAIKSALPQIEAAHPGLSITCYGLPGARFDAASTDAAGRFRPDPSDAGAAKLAKRINGTVALDLTTFDDVLVIGDTLGMPATLFVAVNYDVTDWPTRRGRSLLSGAGFRSAMTEAIGARVAHLAKQFRGIRPLHAALAPYPTTRVIPAGPLHQQPYAALSDHPEAGRIHALYRDALTEMLAAEGIRFVPQPDDTIAQPFLTRPTFGEGAIDFRREGHVLDDHRHMNAAFGASLFRAFALALPQNHVAASPEAAPHAD